MPEVPQNNPADEPATDPFADKFFPEAGGKGELTPDEKMWAMLAHLSALLGNLVGLGQIIAPLVIYLVQKDQSKFVAYHALQSLYFQLAVFAGLAVGVVITAITCGVGFPLLMVVAALGIIYPIVMGIKANQGEWDEYWLVGEFAKKAVGVDDLLLPNREDIA